MIYAISDPKNDSFLIVNYCYIRFMYPGRSLPLNFNFQDIDPRISLFRTRFVQQLEIKEN